MVMRQYRKKKIQYFKAYQWSNVYAMLKNNRKAPKVCDADFKGRLVVITGATSGIGYLAATKYASKGADLLCVNRNKDKSESLKNEIEKEFKVTCRYYLADLSRIKETHQLADKLSKIERPIDVLIHNAGVYLTKRELTEDGIEKVFMVHYLSSFIINYKLQASLSSQEKSRIILVNSEGHRFAAWGLRLDDLNWDKRRYSGLKSYGSAKLAQLLSVLIFAQNFADSGVTINAMHPGAVKTDTGRENGRFYRWYKKNILDKWLKPASISAEALYYLGASKELEGISGKFFNLTSIEEPTPPALDMETAQLLWDKSVTIGKLG